MDGKSCIRLVWKRFTFAIGFVPFLVPSINPEPQTFWSEVISCFNIGYADRNDTKARQQQMELANTLPEFPEDNKMTCNWCKWQTDKCAFITTTAGLHLLNWTCYRCGGITYSKTANVHYKEF